MYKTVSLPAATDRNCTKSDSLWDTVKGKGRWSMKHAESDQSETWYSATMESDKGGSKMCFADQKRHFARVYTSMHTSSNKSEGEEISRCSESIKFGKNSKVMKKPIEWAHLWTKIRFFNGRVILDGQCTERSKPCKNHKENSRRSLRFIDQLAIQTCLAGQFWVKYFWVRSYD